MTEDKKPTAPKKTRPSKPKSEKVVAPKVEVKEEAEKLLFDEKVEEKPKTEVVKQPDPPVAKTVLPPSEGHPPVEPGPTPTVAEALEAVGVQQTLYGGGRLKKRLRTRESRYE